jgi:hypothetical protein
MPIENPRRIVVQILGEEGCSGGLVFDSVAQPLLLARSSEGTVLFG